MKANVQQLVIELTRRCNMSCPHCLRGKSQDTEIPFETAKKIIDSFDHIDSITFSGGEPTLCEDLIEKIVYYIISEKKDVNGFYMASNGKKFSIRVMTALVQLYGYIYTSNGYMDEGQCCFDISLDQYHSDISEDNINMLKAFSFVSHRNDIPDTAVIAEGNAVENGIGVRPLNLSKRFYVTWEKDESHGNEYELVYVNSKGNIFPECDFSYDTCDNLLPQVSILSNKEFDDLVEEYDALLGEEEITENIA